ncbi:ATP-dependent DNA helicase RecG [soil metagenome]
MDKDTPVTSIKGVGDEIAAKLKRLGVSTLGELLENYPRRYEDYSNVQNIQNIKPGAVTIKAVIKQSSGRYVRRGLHITEAVASDKSGSVRLVWFNQPYRAASLKKGTEYYISGDFQLSRQRLSILNPSIELVSAFPVNTARIVPVYRETKGLKSFHIRKIVQLALGILNENEETLPEWVMAKYGLLPRTKAVQIMHFPATIKDLSDAKHRLGFEEVFELSLAALLNKHELMQEKAISIPFQQKLARDFVSHLPFKLTDSQRKAVWRIYQDMERSQPMNRLVEGDVGSGKTVVAAMAAVMVVRQDFQVAMMAPTELLARQHHETLQDLLRPLKMEPHLALLVGSLKNAQKNSIYKDISSGKARFMIGTHALIQDKVDISNLGLVIVDEQHRFGVDQRKRLQAKAGYMPHVLSMTATPIPRSLALTLYGELDISIIDAKPAGRLPVKTEICSPNSRPQLYAKIEIELKKGRQMFVVCPLIAESDLLDARSAEEVYEKLRKGAFKRWRVGLLHGKLKTEEKDEIMRKFVAHELDILVATTVIEVGVNVPNATVMLVENAERFGLAQIHQLRGRVGRNEQQGYCYLMTNDSQGPSRRLRALESSSDGFKLAELDLEIRGPGAIYGTAQHGELDLRVAKLSDVRLISQARATAGEFIDRQENLLQYPHLHSRVARLRAVTNLN